MFDLSVQIKKAQQKISMVLESKGINFEIVDIAASAEDKDKMRDLAGDPKALPPQIVNDGVYCGVFKFLHLYFGLQFLH